MRLVSGLLASLLVSVSAWAKPQVSLGMGMQTKITPTLSNMSFEAQSDARYFFGYDWNLWEILFEIGQVQGQSQVGNLQVKSSSYLLAPWARRHWTLGRDWGSFIGVGAELTYQEIEVNLVNQPVRRGADTGLAPGVGAGVRGQIYRKVLLDGEARIVASPFQKLALSYELGLKLAVRF